MSRLYMKMLIAACLAACKCQVLIRCLWNYFQALQLMSSLQTEPLFWEIYIYVCARNCSSYTVKINEPGFKTSRLTWVSWGNLKQVAKLQNFVDFFFFFGGGFGFFSFLKCCSHPTRHRPGQFAFPVARGCVLPDVLHPLLTPLGALFPLPSRCLPVIVSTASGTFQYFSPLIVVFFMAVWLLSPSEVPEGFSPLVNKWDLQLFIWTLWSW